TPCPALGGALAEGATGGEVIVEASGGYGPLAITKAVSINAAPGVVAFSGLPVTVNASNAVVVLRGLIIDGGGAAGSGIDAQAVGSLHVESCVILGFNGNGINFSSSGQLFVKDTMVRNTSNYGIFIAPASLTARASIDSSRIENNQVGVVSFSSASATITESVLAGQTLIGASAGGTGELTIESCLVANNFVGITSNAGTTIRVSNTTVTDNSTGLSIVGGALLSRSNNTVEGNGTNGVFSGTYAAN